MAEAAKTDIESILGSPAENVGECETGIDKSPPKGAECKSDLQRTVSSSSSSSDHQVSSGNLALDTIILSTQSSSENLSLDTTFISTHSMEAYPDDANSEKMYPDTTLGPIESIEADPDDTTTENLSRHASTATTVSVELNPFDLSPEIISQSTSMASIEADSDDMTIKKLSRHASTATTVTVELNSFDLSTEIIAQNTVMASTESKETDVEDTIVHAGSPNVDESQSQHDMSGTSYEMDNTLNEDKRKEEIEHEEKPDSIENEEETEETHSALIDETQETSDTENINVAAENDQLPAQDGQLAAENDQLAAEDGQLAAENDRLALEDDELPAEDDSESGLGASNTPSTVTLISSTDSDRMSYLNDVLPAERHAQQELEQARILNRLFQIAAGFESSESDVGRELDRSVSSISEGDLNAFDNEHEREIIPQAIIEGEESDANELAKVCEANLDKESVSLNKGTDKNKEDLQNKPSEKNTVTDDKTTDLEAVPRDKEVNNDSHEFCDTNREINEDVILDSESMKDSLQEVDEASQSTSHKDGGEFIHVNMDIGQDCSSVDKDGSSSMDIDKDKESGELRVEQDPIGDQDIVNDSDNITETDNANEQGADEELCIIPDTERVISQAEKEAASALPKLRDLTETSITEDTSNDLRTDGSSSTGRLFVNRNEGDNDLHTCENCLLKRTAKYTFTKDGSTKYICSDECLKSLKNLYPNEIIMSGEGEIRVKDLASCKEQPKMIFVRKCATCRKKTDNPELNLTWEIMDFCNEFCLSKYQREIGSKCSSCSTDVRPNSLGKYCVRFGNDIRQFCTSHCLEEYKKGLKVCSYCQQDISVGPDGFLAAVGDKGQFKDFCSQTCMEKYDIMTNDRPPKVSADTKCCVCAKDGKSIAIEFYYKDQSNYFCGEPCFVAFSFVNKITAGKCAMCKRNFTRYQLEKFTMFYDNVQYSFCSNSCQNIYIVAHRKIVPCSWCKVKKYNFDMIRRYSQPEDVLNMCSVNCLSLYQVSVNALTSKKVSCDFCMKQSQPMYHLTMSDATIRNFCSYSCCITFQAQFPKTSIAMTTDNPAKIPVVPAGAPRKSKKLPHSDRSEEELGAVPIMSSVHSSTNTNGNAMSTISTRSTRSKSNNLASAKNISVVNNVMDTAKNIHQIKQQIIIKPYPIPEQRNVATLTRVRTVCKSTSTTKVNMVNKEVQTEKREKDKILIPVPVPIYIPAPLNMYSQPVVYPIPFPLPIPIPIFIPTTRNSAAGIMKEIKKVQVKIPSDPYEAELLMMAEMVADDKKEENTDSESDMDETGADDGHFTPEPVDSTNTFGDDMLQMALKMATELEEPAVDLEGALTANTITAPQGQEPQEHGTEPTEQIHLMERQPVRGRKRGISRGSRAQGGPSKRGRRAGGQEVSLLQPVQQPPPPPEPVEKPDANMCLKYTFGVNAWKQWVTTKNSELEKSSRRLKLFKTEILQLTADELNYSLCLFVKEVRKPNGAEYAPDTIYYLCLGIQQYLFENGRIDNIFCDPYYEKFTDCLDEVARKFSVLYNDSHYIVTRVEEEHLWESKQLGAHSPHVLLSTLMFFNTKHFNLTTVDEHMQLSFSHIMKHWKRNPNQPGASKAPGSRNVLLRFYPPQSALQNNTRKKKVYEQQENEENPLRCPVKLYEFYLSKCPESVKTRNDVFYLQPERSCVPDSPVWYSTMPLPRESLEKMLHRVKMVKEINVALLTS